MTSRLVDGLGRIRRRAAATGQVGRVAIAIGFALALGTMVTVPSWFTGAGPHAPLVSLASADQPEGVLEDFLDLVRDDPNPTMNNPYFWAWQTFVSISKPVKVAGLPKGRPRPTLWETWATDGETFPECPTPGRPPKWPGDSYREKHLVSRTQTAIHPQSSPAPLSWYELQNGVPVVVATLNDPEEVRRNKTSFDYIAKHELYYTQGLAAAYRRASAAVAATNGTTSQAMAAVIRTVQFPTESIEIKADWVPLSVIPKAQRSEFYRNIAVTVDASGNQVTDEYGLVALHILTKQVPFWFWATWLNKNVLGRCDYIGCTDNFGLNLTYIAPNAAPNYPYPDGKLTPALKALIKKGGIDPVFENYRLIGIQTDFTDPTGQPVLMSNTITEQGLLQTASCMTCHARAAVTATGALLSVTSPQAQGETPPPGDHVVADNGTPDPTWFWTLSNDTPYVSSSTKVTGLVAAQLDFVWGFLFAQPAGTCRASRR